MVFTTGSSIIDFSIENILGINNYNPYQNVINKCDNDWYTETKIYKYHNMYPEMQILSNIIYKNKYCLPYEEDNFLLSCYSKIINNDIEHIIYDIIGSPISNDEIVICMLAIDKIRFDLIDLLISKFFDINQLCYCDDTNAHISFDVLTYAIIKNNIPMIKYLIENGADPYKNKMCAFKLTILTHKKHIFDFFIEVDIPYDTLCCAFLFCYTSYNSNDKFDNLKKIFNKGINIKDISSTLIKFIESCDIKIINFLMDNGLNINLIMLDNVCRVSNWRLLDFLLSYGLQIDHSTMNLIF